MDVVVLDPEESKHGAVETREEAKRCAELFRRTATASTASSSPCRTSAKSAPSPTRCAWRDLRVPVLIQATPDDRSQDDHRIPPRQLLRKDVGLQQPAAVRHSLLAHHAAHRELRFRRIREGPGMVRRGLPRRQRTSAICASAHRRAADGVQHGSLQRKDSRSRTAFRSRRSISPKSSAASANERRRRRRAGKAGRHSRSTSRPRTFREPR